MDLINLIIYRCNIVHRGAEHTITDEKCFCSQLFYIYNTIKFKYKSYLDSIVVLRVNICVGLIIK